MKASYNVTKDYCGHMVFKSELMKIRDNSVESAGNVSSDQLTQFAPPAIGAGNINGKLYRNYYVYYCLNCILPTRRITWEVEGYNTKLSETEQLVKWYILHYAAVSAVPTTRSAIGTPACWEPL